MLISKPAGGLPEVVFKPGSDVASTILDTVGALVVVMDREGVIYCFNKACQHSTGYTFEEVKGKKLWDLLLLPEDIQQVKSVFQNIFAGNFPNQNENRWIAKDGTCRSLAWSNTALLDQAGQVELLVGTGVDLTELQLTGDALKRSEAKTQALLAAIPDMIFQLSGEGVFLNYSAPFNAADIQSDLLLAPSEFLGKSVREVLPENLAVLAIYYVTHALETRQTQVCEYELNLRGERQVFEARLVVSGENEVLAIVRNVTDRKRSEQFLLRHDAVLEAINFAAKRFLESPNWEEFIGEFQARLGEAAEVSRVYIFKNIVGAQGALLTSMISEWCALDISPQINDTSNQAASYEAESFRRMAESLSRGEIFSGHVREFTPAERDLLEPQNISSLLLVPIFAGKEWWGFIGFDECKYERKWSPAEVEALEMAAGILGTAIERSRVSKVITSAVRISDAAHFAQNLDELYKAIHDIVSELMPAKNFYIGVYDAEDDLIRFPYFLDEVDLDAPAHPPGQGLTEYVLRTGKTLLASPEVFDQLVLAGEVEEIGAPCIDWLGVPLQTQDKTIGVLVVQSYTPGVRFGQEHAHILELVSSQVAMAIERKRGEEALRASEEQYRSLVETSLDAILLIDMDATIKLCNRQTALVHGYDRPEELIGQNLLRFFAPESTGAVEQDFREVLETGGARDKEYTILQRDGTRLPAELSASLVRNAKGEPKGLLVVERDITERKRREMEREAIITVAGALRSASTRAHMPPVILKSLTELLNAQGAGLILCRSSEGAVVELASGEWAPLTGQRLEEGSPCMQAVEMGQILHYDGNDSSTSLVFKGLKAVICVALIAQNQVLGALCVGRSYPFKDDEIRILSAISDMAGNAIHRADLHEQTQRRVQRLAALRAVDMAISSSLDLRVTLNVLLDQLTVQLNVEAGAILLFNQHARTLDFAAARGFNTLAIHRTQIRLGEHYTGRAVLERRTFHLEGLPEKHPDFLRERGLGNEGFMTYYAVPLVAKGQLKGLMEVFQRSDYHPDSEWLDFLETMAGQAAIAIDNASMFNELQRSNMELALAYDTTLEGWVHALDLRDQETEGHTQRVTEVTLRLARTMGKSEAELIHVRRGVLLHDIGKIAIPDSILQKPGPLNEREWEVMRRHPVYAYELLSPITYLQPSIDIPYCHHEKWDGSGYPRKLQAEQIPITARIFAVVDVWDALRSDRPYRKGWPDEKVHEYIWNESGKHFDPEVVGLFLPMIEGRT